MTVTASYNQQGTIDAVIDDVAYAGLPLDLVKSFLRDPETDEVTENFTWSSPNRFRQMVADEYENKGIEVPAYVGTTEEQQSARDQDLAALWAEANRRLALGFDYDFGDGRGVHHINTSPADMAGWSEVDKWANTKTQLGQPEATTVIKTATGIAYVTPMEWFHIIDKANDVRQPIYRVAFALVAQNPVPTDFRDDMYWTVI